MVLVVDFEASELGRQSKATNDADLAAFDSTLNAAGYNKTDLYTMASWLGSRIDTNDSNKAGSRNGHLTQLGRNIRQLTPGNGLLITALMANHRTSMSVS